MNSITLNFLDLAKVNDIWHSIETEARWRYRQMSGDHYHWTWPVMTLCREPSYNINDLWYSDSPTWIKEITENVVISNQSLYVNRVIINGQTCQMHSAVHRDNLNPDSRTFLIYLNPEWHSDWGGETLFFSHDKSVVVQSVLPTPGTLVSYPGNQYHQGKGPEKAGILRVTLAIQMTPVHS